MTTNHCIIEFYKYKVKSISKITEGINSKKKRDKIVISFFFKRELQLFTYH